MYPQTIVVPRLPRAPLRISPPEGTHRFWRAQNPPNLHLRAAPPVVDRFPLHPSGALHTPGDLPPLPIRPIAAHTDRQTHTKNEKDSQFILDDGRSSLLANAWYSTRELAACLRVDTSTLRRWRTARPPQGPPFVAVSERVVMYSAVDVEEWLLRRRTVPRRDA
ncbi:helix-turn-helix transcriptional regulator [Streptomyces griseus]|uniref:helix-turn-helix transcriptional regulator n=1 Tax=Streptomyces griseus TaxID=1911 RepID=UPI0033C1EF70